MIVYIDLIFLINFFIDTALVLTTAWTRNNTVNGWRIAGAGGIGAAYVVMMFFPQLSFLFTFAVKFIFSIFMIGTAFGFGSLQTFMRNLGTFYLVNFAAAGGVLGIHYFFLSSNEVMNGIFFSRTGGILFQMKLGIGFTLLTLLFVLWFYLRMIRSNKQRVNMASFIADVRITVDQFMLTCKGLVDTGNQLYDPLTKTPVMVVEVSLWKEVLPEAWIRKIQLAGVGQTGVEQMIATLDSEPFIWQDRLRLVPYRGINNRTQFLLAIKPDAVFITYNDKQVESRKVLIGLDGSRLSSDGAYQAIIHPMLLES